MCRSFVFFMAFLSRKHEPQMPDLLGIKKIFKKYSTNVEKTIDIRFLQM